MQVNRAADRTGRCAAATQRETSHICWRRDASWSAVSWPASRKSLAGGRRVRRFSSCRKRLTYRHGDLIMTDAWDMVAAAQAGRRLIADRWTAIVMIIRLL